MAFTNVNSSGKFLKITELAQGESITGYYLGATDSATFEGKFNVMLEIGGEEFSVAAIGNLHYIVLDRKLTPGQMTRITRTEDKKVKGGKKATQVIVEQDPEDVKAGLRTVEPKKAAAKESSAGLSSKIAAMKGA